VGSLLSGGLDSSLVAAIAARELKKVGKKLHTYSIGMDPDSLDLLRARQVAEHIGSIHHEILFTAKEGQDAIKEMIQLLETYDVTTIRASTPMYIMSKVIAKDGIKVVLSGEGADEIFGGYLYFAHAPTSKDFHEECIRRIGRLHTADLLRADRSTMGASVEARVPFLDKEFLEISMRVDPEFKMIKKDRCEKWILRKAFEEEGLIPEEVLWRQKEQFSDGVGYSWVDGLKELAESVVSEELYEIREKLYPHQVPLSKEAFMYRELFEQAYSHPDVKKQVKRWIPKWQDYNIDPSGRANTVHVASVEKKEETKAGDLALVGK
ncbi:MAG: asparagine synthase-related protein, partial [Halobacteriovoraceae bacterium]|nr:asparagine synthase-related protein [Halobacteriovoraceae bacterium]